MDPELKAYIEAAKANGYSMGEISAKLKEKYGIHVPDTDVSFRNVGRSAVQGLTFNFGDEILGLLPEAIGGGAKAKEEWRANDKAFQKDHPWVDAGAQLAGGLLIPGGIAAKGAKEAIGVGKIALRAAKYGAVAGGVAGVGSGEGFKDSAIKGAVGAGMGGATGALIPAAVASGLAVKEGLAGITASGRAARRLAHAVEQEGGPKALTQRVDQFVNDGLGDELTVGDLGPHMREATDFAVNNSDGIHADFSEQMHARQAGATERLADRAKQLTGRPVASRIKEGTSDLTQRWADSEHGFQGLRDKYPQLLDPNGMAEVLNQPKVKGAWQEAQKHAMIGEFPDVGMPSFEMAQNVRMDLEDMTAAAYRAGKKNLGDRLKSAKNELTDELEKRVPGYKKINAEYKARKGVEQALEDGQKAWTTGGLAELQDAITRMDPDARNMFRQGLASEMLDKLDNTSTNVAAARQLMNGSAVNKRRLELIFGDAKSLESFMQRAQNEREFNKMLQGPLGNSQTHRRSMAADFDPGDIAMDAATGGVIGTTASRVTRGLGKRAVRALNRGTAEKLGKTLTTTGEAGVRDVLKNLYKVKVPRIGRGLGATLPGGIGAATPGMLESLLGD